MNRICKSANLSKLIITHGVHDPDTLESILQSLADQKREPEKQHPGGVASFVQGVIAAADRLGLRARYSRKP